MSVSDRLGGLSTDGFAKLTNSQPIHHARSTHLDPYDANAKVATK